MYTQKQSYQLTKDGYMLSSKTIVVRGIHKNKPQITWSIQHIWRSKFKRKIIITDPVKNVTEVPENFIETRTEERLSCNYFQMDDSTYYVQIRGLIKNCTPKLIDYLTEKRLLKL